MRAHPVVMDHCETCGKHEEDHGVCLDQPMEILRNRVNEERREREIRSASFELDELIY